jgi:hypothetical protein
MKDEVEGSNSFLILHPLEAGQASRYHMMKGGGFRLVNHENLRSMVLQMHYLG